LPRNLKIDDRARTPVMSGFAAFSPCSGPKREPYNPCALCLFRHFGSRGHAAEN